MSGSLAASLMSLMHGSPEHQPQKACCIPLCSLLPAATYTSCAKHTGCVQPGDREHEAALQYSVDMVEHHSHGEVNPSSVDLQLAEYAFPTALTQPPVFIEHLELERPGCRYSAALAPSQPGPARVPGSALCHETSFRCICCKQRPPTQRSQLAQGLSNPPFQPAVQDMSVSDPINAAGEPGSDDPPHLLPAAQDMARTATTNSKTLKPSICTGWETVSSCQPNPRTLAVHRLGTAWSCISNSQYSKATTGQGP